MKKSFLFFLVIFVIFSDLVFSQNIRSDYKVTGEIKSAEQGMSEQEFRRGVQAFYRGMFNEAILQFEKALSYQSDDNRILEWMGKAYYYSGLEGIAIQEWEKAVENGYGGLLLENKLEIIRERRVNVEEDISDLRFTEASVLPGVYNDNLIFSAPVSILPNNNGTFWVLAYGSNELLLMNINGIVINRITGPINGFDHPLDLIRLKNGNMLVTEFRGDRLALLSKKGKFIKYIGKKGRGNGEFLGPQYACQDDRQNIFVTDYGNRRVNVFDREGNALFNFGKETKNFPGLKGPTGIAVISDIVYVSDNVTGCIYEFDLSGNYIDVLVENKTFKNPESLKVWNNFLILCDNNKVFSIDSKQGITTEIIKTGNAPSKLTSAVADVNGLVLACDIKTNEIYVMAKMKELVGGLFVQIEKVNADNFPEVKIEVKVENRHRKPVVGIKENNFYITEDKRPVNKLKFTGAASDNEYGDVTVIIDRSLYTQKTEETDFVDSTVKSIAQSMNGKGVLRIISASNLPVKEYEGRPTGVSDFSVKGLKASYSKDVSLDLAFRLASNDLINAAKKRAIILVTSGKAGLSSFNKYSLSETSAYMNNNSISCSVVYSDPVQPDEEINYIVNSTGGKSYYIFREEGISDILDEIWDIPVGIYGFTYTSSLSTNFGQKFLPVEVETYLLNGSGRDESGYFAPLE